MLRHGVDALLRRQVHVEAEPVHADVGAVVDQLLEVAEVGGVAGVADHHAGQVDALLGEDRCCSSPRRVAGVGVGGDRHAGLPVRLCDRAQHPLDAGGHAGFVGGALEDRRLDAGVGDALVMSRTNMLDHESPGRPARVPGPWKWKYSGTSL